MESILSLALFHSRWGTVVCDRDTGSILQFNPMLIEMLASRQKTQLEGKLIGEIEGLSRLTEFLSTKRIQIIENIAFPCGKMVCLVIPQETQTVFIIQHALRTTLSLEQMIHAQELSKQMDVLMESSHDGIYIADGEGNPINFNKAFAELLELSRPELAKKNAALLVEEGFIQESVVVAVLKEKRMVTRLIQYHNGREGIVTGTPVFDEDGNIFRVVCNVRDLTELKELEKELTQSKTESALYKQQLDQLKLVESHHLQGMVIKSEAMKRVMQVVLRMGKVESTVLLQGESGVGKEAVVQVLHKESTRAHEPLIKVNCGAIPEQLLEAELFGYEKGAFTGASKEGKPGMFELAQEGTLFLDEIGELPFILQSKLLRAIQEREVYRIGGTKPYQIKARLVVATNRDLKRMVEEKQFREDLYYRLHVIPITIPPLRERKEDIVPLTYYFVDQFNQKYGYKKRFDKNVLEVFERYQWPGNVRELQNTIERMVVLNDQDYLTREDIPSSIIEESHPHAAAITISGEFKLDEAKEQVERIILQQAKSRYHTVRKMGKALGVSHSTVVMKMMKYGI